MLARVDAADRLVREVEHRGSVPAAEASRILLALATGPELVVEAVLDDVVARDARLAWRGRAIELAPAPGADVSLDEALFAVIDLETTGFVPGAAQISEIGGVLLQRGRIRRELEIVLARRNTAPRAVGRLLSFARDAVIVGHNVRFDIAFLDQELARMGCDRIASQLLDTMVLARRLLGDRVERASLAALADFYGTSSVPCHRALPDARATAEILIQLLDVAAERGARTVADICALTRSRVTPVDHLA